jgi:hypothetical protein
VDTFGQLIIQYTLLFNILADVFGLTLKYVWRRGRDSLMLILLKNFIVYLNLPSNLPPNDRLRWMIFCISPRACVRVLT